MKQTFNQRILSMFRLLRYGTLVLQVITCTHPLFCFSKMTSPFQSKNIVFSRLPGIFFSYVMINCSQMCFLAELYCLSSLDAKIQIIRLSTGDKILWFCNNHSFRLSFLFLSFSFDGGLACCYAYNGQVKNSLHIW